ncbi:hypothetical protein [Marinicella meishanensis]|uniref:hypothetical protein n=1 Tax=Marinicella meishanensis TaxID=2873263 RepID=UPI001CBF1BBE|nr:hypothetical protein [Marinicella sp. NBU2979]
MIHVLTIHWKSADWIDIQIEYLKKHIKQPFRIYTFLNHIPEVNQHRHKFFYSSTEDIRLHPVKLNLLADIAGFAADSEEDYLLFIDGDAFPIASVDEFIDQTLEQYPIAAVQRTENNGDIQPHPCFCVMKIKTWKEIEGDWKHGQVLWKDVFGKDVWDVGGKMLKILNERNMDWYKMHRSNHHDMHPLLFGVYDQLVYHHGAAFRNPGTRIDRNQVAHFEEKLARFRKAKKYLPLWLARWLFNPLKYEVAVNRENSKKVFEMLKQDPNFHQKLNQHD